jgi:hypothetical protein
MALTVHCLVCDRTYVEPEVNLETCPHCFNADMSRTVYLQASEDDLSDRDTALMEWADEIDEDPYADSEWSAPRIG